MRYLDVNSVKTDYFFKILSSPFHIHDVLKLAPVLSQKSEKMHLVRTFCSSTAKTSTVTPIFYFMILIRTVPPFDEKKIYVQFFGNFTKLKTRSLKGIFLVRKWINRHKGFRKRATITHTNPRDLK